MDKRPNCACAFCGKPLFRYPSQLRKSERPFCDASCARQQQMLEMEAAEPNCQCAYCGKELRRKPAVLKRHEGVVYCDRKCKGAGTKKRNRENPPEPNTECAYCGKAIYKRGYQLREKNYCDNTCKGKAKVNHEPNAVCELCGKEFRRAPKHLSRVAHNFCSLACASEANNLIAGKEINGLESDFWEMFPDLKFVGDGKLWVNAGKFRINPDFISPNGKIIELWGDYWHRNDDPAVRIQQFKDAGYECLIIWEGDFRRHFPDVKNRVENFLYEW